MSEISRLSILNENVRLVVLQFSCSNKNAMPTTLKWLKKETMIESDERLANADLGDGELFMDTEVNTVSVYDFLRDLDRAEYAMVDAFCQERQEMVNKVHCMIVDGFRYTRSNDCTKYFYMARFVFCRLEYYNTSEYFARDVARAEFERMAMSATWRVKGYNNPYYEKDEKILGQRAMNINMVARNPLFDNTGHWPLKRWQRDEWGEKIGEAPLLVKPEFYLRIQDNHVVCTGYNDEELNEQLLNELLLDSDFKKK